MGKSGRDYTNGVSVGKSGGRSHVADCGTATKREEGVQGDWVGGGHLECRSDDYTSPAHDRDHVS